MPRRALGLAGGRIGRPHTRTGALRPVAGRDLLATVRPSHQGLAPALERRYDASMSQHPRFHLAFPVRDLQEARHFYGGILGCPEGRSAPDWVDFDFFGHQIVAHLCCEAEGPTPTNEVDEEQVPVRHFGVVLDMDQWAVFADRLKDQGVVFLIEPQIRFQGQVGEQATCFFLDPSGNALEIKAFADDNQVFAR